MLRRHLLRTVAAAAVAATTACATTTAVPPQLATDVNLIATGLAAAIAGIKQIPGVPIAALTQLDADLATIQVDAARITSATAGTAISTIQEIGQVVEAIAAVALPLIPGGSTVETTIEAAVSLLPVILAAVGSAGAARTARLAGDGLASPEGRAVRTTFTPEQARLILAAAH
ncbi:hypothetical protein [Rhodopila sp.]|uniref:hypothetical protein n=1 Tax=Rhodopila sp. TaxID=2480087 RepID=UPI003D0C57F2